MGGLKGPSIYSSISGLISYTPPSSTPPFEPSELLVLEGSGKMEITVSFRVAGCLFEECEAAYRPIETS